jgi:hypothetical protein
MIRRKMIAPSPRILRIGAGDEESKNLVSRRTGGKLIGFMITGTLI